MKTLITAILTMILSAVSFAQQNPDVTPSIEIMLHQQFNTYKYGIEDAKNKPTGINIKFIEPFNKNISFILGGGYFSEKLEYKRINVTQEFQSFYINVGAKIYFWEKEKELFVHDVRPLLP